MREHFVVNQIKELLHATPPKGEKRADVNVMLSYCWKDTDFVLSRLAMELAPRIRKLWLDRLGGEDGMGEFAHESMERGVTEADVIIAVVSPAYIASTNCGHEMELAHRLGKPVIPVVLNLPLASWPPSQIGQTAMTDQFATEAGGVKIYVDMTDSESFFQKFHNELFPRVDVAAHAGLPKGDAGNTMASKAMTSEFNAILASDDAPSTGFRNDSGSAARKSRPKKNNKVAPAPEVTAALPEAADETSPGKVIRGACTKCGKSVFASQERDVDESGAYFHMNAKDCSVNDV